MKEMKVNYELTEEDLVNLNIFNTNKYYKKHKLLVISFVISLYYIVFKFTWGSNDSLYDIISISIMVIISSSLFIIPSFKKKLSKEAVQKIQANCLDFFYLKFFEK